MKKDVLQLPPAVASPQDVASLIQDLKMYHQWFAHNEIKQKVKATKGTPPPVISEVALGLIRQAAATHLLSAKHIEALIRVIEKSVKDAPVVSITLAAPANTSLRQSIITWCRSQLAPNTLVNFSFNDTILGGMIIRAGSHVIDASFRRKLLASSHAFTEHLNHV